MIHGFTRGKAFELYKDSLKSIDAPGNTKFLLHQIPFWDEFLGGNTGIFKFVCLKQVIYMKVTVFP